MSHAQWLLELVLILLLAATLFHAVRLERALGVLKRDRGVLEGLVAGFNDSTRQAESSIERLRNAADGAGRQIGRQIEQAQLLRDELEYLGDKSDRLSQRLEAAIRSARMIQDAPPALPAPAPAAPAGGLAAFAPPGAAPLPFERRRPPSLEAPPPRPMAAQERQAPLPPAPLSPPPLSPAPASAPGNETADLARLRSQAERDLLRALRGAR
jgi:hypothetical protein